MANLIWTGILYFSTSMIVYIVYRTFMNDRRAENERKTNEVILNAPSYTDRSTVRPASGFADWPFILIKQRLLSANEQNGNYIVTAFFQIRLKFCRFGVAFCGPMKSRPSGPGSVKPSVARCARSSGRIAAGSATLRCPASDFGPLMRCSPLLS